jgi:osmotically-inducible protein OsmY
MTTMSKTERARAVAVAALMLLTLTLWSLFDNRATASRPLPDADTAGHLEEALQFDPAIPFDRIDVRVQDGIANLSGTVDNLLVRERAARIAETVRGIRAVINRIQVEPGTRYTATQLQHRVQEAIADDPVADGYQIEVEANDAGEVTLNGTVDSWPEHQLSENLAMSVSGVTAVHNRMAVTDAEAGVRRSEELVPEIQGRLQWDVLVDASRIAVDVENGMVGLSGVVGSAAEKRRALSAAWVAGVTAVDGSELRVVDLGDEAYPQRPREPARSDEAIRAAIRDAFRYDPRIPQAAIEVRVTNGIVTLTGIVDNAQARRAAARDAGHTVGVIGVKNLVKLRPLAKVDDATLARRVGLALSRNPYVDRSQIELRVADQAVYLAGTVDSYFDKAEAENLAFRVAGVARVHNALRVAAPQTMVYDPYVQEWSIYDYPWYPGPVDPQNKSDVQLLRDIEDQLFWSPFLDSRRIDVEVEAGTAVLTGTVDNWAQYAAARENALEAGSLTVVNRLRIE